MSKPYKGKTYKKCLGNPFMAHIDARGNVWPCVAHIGDEEFLFGNINESTFDRIWEGEQRIRAIQAINAGNINEICQSACRLDEINKYLNELKHPGEHVNFI